MRKLLFWSLVLSGWLWADQGVFYFAEGGSGGGLVHLLTPSGLVKLRWKRESFDATGVKQTEAWRWGARWDFRHEEGWLSEARYLQQRDVAVSSAMASLQAHLQHLRKAEMKAAYAGVSAPLQSAQALRPFSALQWKASPPTFAFKVIGHNSAEVLVMVDSQALWKGPKNAYRYTLQKLANQWIITEIKAYSKADFDEC